MLRNFKKVTCCSSVHIEKAMLNMVKYPIKSYCKLSKGFFAMTDFATVLSLKGHTTSLLHKTLVYGQPRRNFNMLSRHLNNRTLNLLQTSQQVQKQSVKLMSDGKAKQQIRSTVLYICAGGILMFGAAFAGVPLYRMFCQSQGLGGRAVQEYDTEKIEKMEPDKHRQLKIVFGADTSSALQWNFKPQQQEINVVPGETALAFYTAKNPTDKAVIGISTYNILPYSAGKYFNKIQCFCFEEQILNPHEQVDMPVFFYIDPEFSDDPKCAKVQEIRLSYTFFKAKDGAQIPLPGFMTEKNMA